MRLLISIVKAANQLCCLWAVQFAKVVFRKSLSSLAPWLFGYKKAGVIEKTKAPQSSEYKASIRKFSTQGH